MKSNIKVSFEPIKAFINKLNAKLGERKKRIAAETANELFQIREHNSQVWLTFNGNNVCPIELFSTKNAVVVVNTIRDIYLRDNYGDELLSWKEEKTLKDG